MKPLRMALSSASFIALMTLPMQGAQASNFLYRIPLPGVRPEISAALKPSPNAGACASGALSTCATFGGQLTETVGASAQGVVGSVCKSSGRWYYEVTPSAFSGSPAVRAAIVGWSSGTPTSNGNGTTDSATFGFSEYIGLGNYASRNSEVAIGGTAYEAPDVIGVAIDLDAHILSVYRQGALDAVVYTGIPAGTYCPIAVRTGSLFNDSAASTFNFGQSNFAYPVPAGYSAGVY
jgi:hypothetical protein